MKKYLFTCLILLTGFLTAHAQSNYRSGYIITNDGDTLSGWVDYRTDAINAAVCKFKPTLIDKETVFYPGQIAGYRFADGGKYYISKEITIKESRRTVFLEYLAQGIMNLYFYDNEADNSCSYFFEDENGKMTAVSKKQDEVVEDKEGITRKVVDDSYKGMINYLFREYEPVKNETLQIKYTHKSMLDLLKGYQNQVCTTQQECNVFETKPDKLYLKTTFSVYGGVDCARFYHNFSDVYKYERIHFCSPIIGVKTSFKIPRWNKSFSLQLDFSLNKLNLELNNVYTDTLHKFSVYDRELGIKNYYTDRISFTFDEFNLTLNYGIKYTYPKGFIRPSLEIGKNLFYTYNRRSKVNVKFHDMYSHSMEYELNYDDVIFRDPNTYIAVGLNFHLGHDHFLFLEYCKVRPDYNPWQMKLGYTF